MSNIESTLTDSQIDATINDLDRVMNGCEPGDVVPEFTADCMVKMRAVIRKMVAGGGGAALTQIHPSHV